jgi:hypothetical protein
MLQKLVGCQGEMITPTQLRELLLRTGTSCAMVDRNAGLLVIFGLTRSTMGDISLCLLESPNHARSYFEAAGWPGRTLNFDELCEFAEAEGLQLIHHREGSRYWKSRPVGGDSTTPVAKDAKANLVTPGPPGLRFTRPSSRPGYGGDEPSTLRPAVSWNVEDKYSPIRALASVTEVDHRRAWLARLEKDEPLQHAVGKGLFFQLHLDAKGLTTVCDMESLFVTGRLSWTIISVPEASK